MTKKLTDLKLTDLTGNEIRVYQYLRAGKKNSRSKEWLCNKTELDEREVRRAIHGLRLKGYPICSATEHPGGYWLCNDEQDLVCFIADLKIQRDAFSKAIKHLEKLLKYWSKK